MLEPFEAAGESGVPEYMVSYADMLTILLCFFIVLYSTSGTTSDGADKGEKGGKGAAASQNPTGAKQGSGPREGPGGRLGVGLREGGGWLGDKPSQSSENHATVPVEKVFESLYYRFGPDWTLANCWTGGPTQLRGGSVESGNRNANGKPPASSRRGLSGNDPYRARAVRSGDDMLVGGRIYFGEFSAALTEQETEKLRKATDELAGKIQKIEIRAHTSARPLPAGSAYHDHWELAFDRCRKVRDFLVAGGVEPGRIRLSASADNEPLETTDDVLPANRNSRVEVRWLNEYMKIPSGDRSKGSGSRGTNP